MLVLLVEEKEDNINKPETGRKGMKENKLTAKDIMEFDEIQADKKATEQTLNIALTYHQNMLTVLNKKYKKWWDDKVERFDLEKGKQWTVGSSGAYVTIIEKEER